MENLAIILARSIVLFFGLLGSTVGSEELETPLKNRGKIALACSGKHPGRNIQNTSLFLIDREKNSLKESRYCGTFEEVYIVLGSTKDNQFVWYSSSPFVINAYGEKILNLRKLEFEYRQTWRQNYSDEDNLLVRGKRFWSAQCKVINWWEAIAWQKKLRC